MEKHLLSKEKNIQQIFKVNIERYDRNFLSKIISKRTLELNYTTEKQYYNFLIENANEKKIFQDLLNIGYSIFYRNRFTFQVFEYIILPQLLLNQKINSKKQIRIWSTACASGQEPYTLAMILENFMLSNNCKFNYHIFATDYCQSHIESAQNGIYSFQHIKNVPLFQFNKWFKEVDDKYFIVDQIKDQVSFSNFDLLDIDTISPPDSIFGDFDIIMCSNLLYYYNNETRNKIFSKLIACGNNSSYYLTSEVERDYFFQKNFVEVYSQSAIFQKPNHSNHETEKY